MSETTRTIKIIFQTDNSSLARAKDAIKGLNQEVTKLAKNLSKTGGTGGGGGLLSGINIGKTPSSTTNSQKSVGGMLTAGLTADHNMFAAVASGTKSALSQMERSLKTSASNQVRELNNLQRAIQKTTQGYQDLVRAAGGGTTDGTRYFNDGMGGGGGGGGGLGGAGGGWRGDSPAPAMRARFNYYRNPSLNNFDLDSRESSQNQQGLAHSLVKRYTGMTPAQLMTSPLALGGAIYGGANALTNMAGNYMMSQAQNRIDAPLFASQMRAASGQSIGSYSLGMANRHGIDLARVDALKSFAKDKDLVDGIFGKGSTEARSFQKYVGVYGTGVAGGIKSEIDSATSGGKNIAARYADMFRGTPVETLARAAGGGGAYDQPEFMSGKSADAERLKREFFKVSIEQRQQMAQSLQDFINADPRNSQRLTEFGQNALGTVQTMGALGMGYSRKKKRNYAEEYLARGEAMGFGSGEQIGMNQALLASGGQKVRGQAHTALALQRGGLLNAAHIMGTFAQYGESGSNRGLMAALSGVSGKGGVDTTASGILAETIMSQQVSGQGTTTAGSKALMQVLGMGATGDARDIRSQREHQGGLGYFDQTFSGKSDNLQMAVDTMVANQVGAKHGLNFYGERALKNMSPEQMLGALRNGDAALPDTLRNRGINSSVIRDYFDGVTSYNASRYVTGTSGSDNGMDSFAKMIGGKTIGEGYKAFKQEGGTTDEFISKYATIMEDTLDMKPDYAKKMALQMLRGDKDLFPDIAAGGFRGPGMDPARRAYLRNKKDLDIAESRITHSDEFQGHAADLSNLAPRMAATMDDFNGNITQGGNKFVAALDELSDAVLTIAKEFKAVKIKPR